MDYSKIQQKPQQNLNAKVKIDLALIDKNITATSVSNGDEELYKNNATAPYAGSFHKLLPHDLVTGQLSGTGKTSYQKLLTALASGKQSYFDTIVLFDNTKNQLADPQASLNYCLIGLDNSSVASPIPPAISSPAAAAEMVELYCQEYTRDVPLINYSTDPDIATVLDVNHMNKPDFLAAFNGPTSGGNVTVQNLFRGTAQGTTEGPYLSQFLIYDIPYGAQTIRQKYTVPKDKVLYNPSDPSTDPTNPVSSPVDFGVDLAGMINIQNEAIDNVFNISDNRFQSDPKFLYRGRCLGEAVHNDQLYQFYYNAAMILNNLGCPIDPGFVSGPNEKSFTSFGGPADILHHLADIAGYALKHAWYHKWQVHRKIRPEAMSILVQNQKDAVPGFNFIDNVLMNNDILNDIETMHTDYYNQAGSYLLSSEFPEGSPTHPAYPAGHATVAGACVTFLKLFFKADELWQDLPNIANTTKRVSNEANTASFIVAQANADGTDLINYAGSIANVTVNGELNKLASNVSLGRDWANVHYRADGDWGNLIGEQLAIQYVKNILSTYTQTYDGTAPVLTLEKFDGTVITVGPDLN